jgi:hypothetical protein
MSFWCLTEIENPITKAVYIRDVLKEMKEDHFVVLYMMCAYLAKLSQKVNCN